MKIKKVIQALLLLALQPIALSVTSQLQPIQKLDTIPLYRTTQQINEDQLIIQHWFRQTSPNIFPPIDQFPFKLSQLVEPEVFTKIPIKGCMK